MKIFMQLICTFWDFDNHGSPMCKEHLNVEMTLDRQPSVKPVCTVSVLRQANPLQRKGNGFLVATNLENIYFYVHYNQYV
jgi:hypothetical protein